MSVCLRAHCWGGGGGVCGGGGGIKLLLFVVLERCVFCGFS